MKKFAVTLSIVIAFIIANTHAASLNRVRRQVVPKEFANINIENYLKNERAVQFQLKCIVYDGPCDRIGKYLKVTIPELLTNQCQNCEPAQRQRAGRLVSHIQQKFPKEWSDAVQKFQGGQVKKEDADRLESLLGVKLDSKLVAPEASTETPVTTNTTAVPVAEVSPAVDASSTTTVAPVSSSVASVSSSTVASAVSTEVPAVSSSVSPEVSSSTSTPTSSSVVPPAAVEISSTVAPVSSSVAPTSAASSTVSPIASSSVVPPEASSSVAPTVVSSTSVSSVSTEAPVTSATSSSTTTSTAAPSSVVEASSVAPPKV